MNDLIPIAFFFGCLLATFGLVRVCDWLRPVSHARPADPADTLAPMARAEEGAP